MSLVLLAYGVAGQSLVSMVFPVSMVWCCSVHGVVSALGVSDVHGVHSFTSRELLVAGLTGSSKATGFFFWLLKVAVGRGVRGQMS